MRMSCCDVTAAELLLCRGVASFSDGPPNSATGRLFFYMTPMDETTQLFTVSRGMSTVQSRWQVFTSNPPSSELASFST
jgi:hypothetical protein